MELTHNFIGVKPIEGENGKHRSHRFKPKFDKKWSALSKNDYCFQNKWLDLILFVFFLIEKVNSIDFHVKIPYCM